MPKNRVLLVFFLQNVWLRDTIHTQPLDFAKSRVTDTSDDVGENDELGCRKIRSNHEIAHKRALLGAPTQDDLSGVDYGISNCRVALTIVKLAESVTIGHFTCHSVYCFTFSLICCI